MKSIPLIIVTLLFLTRPLLAAGLEQNLLLLYSNDVHGETAPCG